MRLPQPTQHSRIHAKIFSKVTHSRKFFSKFRQLRLFGKLGKFSEKIGKIVKNWRTCTNLGEKGKFTGSRKKLVKFTHSCNRKMDFHVHAIFFHFHAFTQFFSIFTHSRNQKSPFTQTAGGPLERFWSN